MSTEKKVEQLEDILRRLLLSPETETFFNGNPVYQDVDGPTFPELKSTYQRLRALYQPIVDSTILRQLSFSTINSLLGVAQNAYNAFEPLKGNTQDSTFRNFAGQLDSFAGVTQSYGTVS